MTHTCTLALGALALAAASAPAATKLEQMVGRLKARHGGSLSETARDVLRATSRPALAPTPKPVVDAIHFKSGDRVSSIQLSSLRDGTVSFAAFATTEIQAKLAAVSDLVTKDTYEVRLDDGSTLVAAFRRNNDPKTLGLETKSGRQDVPHARVLGIETKEYAAAKRLEMKEASKVKLGKVWSGFVDARYSESSGNTELRNVEVNAETVRETAVDRFRLNLFANNASNAGVKSAQRSAGDARFDVFLPNDLFYFMQGRLESDKLQQIDLRTTIGVGLGKTWKGPDGFRLSAGLGYSFTKENFTTNTSNSEGAALVTVDLDKKLAENLTLEHRFIGYPRSGSTRFNAQTNFKSALGDNLSFIVGFLNKYDSDPLPGVEKSDFTLTTGLRRDF